MIALFTVSPMDKGESLSKYVALVVDLVDRCGLEYLLTAMGTIVEGDSDRVFDLIKECHELMASVADRVVTHVSIDDRKGSSDRMQGKIQSIENALGRKVQE